MVRWCFVCLLWCVCVFLFDGLFICLRYWLSFLAYLFIYNLFLLFVGFGFVYSKVVYLYRQSGEQISVDGKISSLRLSLSAVFVLKLLSNMTYILIAQCWRDNFLVSARTSFWLDNKNGKLFDCFNEDLLKTALFPSTVLFLTWICTGHAGSALSLFPYRNTAILD